MHGRIATTIAVGGILAIPLGASACGGSNSSTAHHEVASGAINSYQTHRVSGGWLEHRYMPPPRGACRHQSRRVAAT